MSWPCEDEDDREHAAYAPTHVSLLGSDHRFHCCSVGKRDHIRVLRLTRIRRIFVIKGEHFLTYPDSGEIPIGREGLGPSSSIGLRIPRPGLLRT